MNGPLLVGGLSSAAAALLHIAVIFGGADWYRFVGAGEGMARMVEAGSIRPTLITLGITAVLAVWAWYGIAGAGVGPRLPLMRFCLSGITLVYLTRGLAPFAVAAITTTPMPLFWIWSSLICLTIGLCHAIGLVQVWNRL